jgi:hypothetical protein
MFTLFFWWKRVYKSEAAVQCVYSILLNHSEIPPSLENTDDILSHRSQAIMLSFLMTVTHLLAFAALATSHPNPETPSGSQSKPLSPNQFGLIGPSSVMLFLNGFHFISGHPEQVIHANHHCVITTPSFIQCAIYVPGTNPARLAGVEYIIGSDIFETLPMEERELWHSHQHEVTSGLLLEPGTPEGVDKEAMKILVNTYGKTFHTWNFASKNLDVPMGIPELVNGYTGTGQAPRELVEARDEFFGMNSTEVRQKRTDIKPLPLVDGADSWKRGFVLDLVLRNRTGFAGPGKQTQETFGHM